MRVLSTANKNALEKIYIFSEAFLFARNASLIFVIGKHTLDIRNYFEVFMKSILQQAEQLAQLSDRLLEKAQNGAWQELEEQQKHYAQLVEQLSKTDLESVTDKKVQELLLHTKTTEQKAARLAAENKDNIVKANRTREKASKMQKTLDAFK